MIGGDFQLQGTIGQPVGGTLSGGDFFLTQGMWFPISAGDCEEDGDIDLFDFQQFETCLTGPASLGTVGCACVDMDRNGQIDLLDFARMQVELVVP